MFEKAQKFLTKRRVRRLLKNFNPDRVITDQELEVLEKPEYGRISLTDNYINFLSGKEDLQFEYAKIRKIVAYKIDLFTYDIDALGFQLENDLEIELHQEMIGFVKLLKELKFRYAGFSEKWAKWIMSSPAFDAEITDIWEKT